MPAPGPWLSLVTPSFNQGRYLAATLRSVLDQDYDRFEYVVVDGASTDDTVGILDRYAAHPRLTCLIREPDRGQTDALLKGFACCTGEVLGWLNSDDLLEPGALRAVAEAFRAAPEAAVVTGNLRFIDGQGRGLGSARRRRMSPRDWLTTPMAIYQPSTFFKADAYRSVGGLDPAIRHCMDYDLFMRLASRGYTFVYIDAVLASFRFHDRSKTVSAPWRLWREELSIFRRHGGRPFSAFYYWKAREIGRFFLARLRLKKPR
jgi:glycosyltransferase involved in cell wall biosynthesis